MRAAAPAIALRSIALVTALSLVLAGCTTSGDGADASRSAPPLTSAPPPPPPAPSTPSPSATLTPTPTLSPSESSTPPAASTSAVSSVRECGSSDLTLRVIRGGAAANEQIALITFTNTSRTECSMVGFPGVSLRLRGAQLGAPATRSSKPTATVTLKPGSAASTTLTDVSTCQAALSDTVRVYPPDSTAFFDKPLVLRGCMLYIDPVAPA